MLGDQVNDLKDAIDNERRKSMAAEKSYNQLKNENQNMKGQLEDLKKAVNKNRD